MGNEGNTLETAERYLDEMLGAEKALDYQLWIKRFEKQFLINFSESTFKKDMYSIRYDLGDYKSREYLGSLSGFKDSTEEEKYPGCVRYVWKGIFDKNETLIVVGLHEREGSIHVNRFTYTN